MPGQRRVYEVVRIGCQLRHASGKKERQPHAAFHGHRPSVCDTAGRSAGDKHKPTRPTGRALAQPASQTAQIRAATSVHHNCYNLLFNLKTGATVTPTQPESGAYSPDTLTGRSTHNCQLLAAVTMLYARAQPIKHNQAAHAPPSAGCLGLGARASPVTC